MIEIERYEKTDEQLSSGELGFIGQAIALIAPSPSCAISTYPAERSRFVTFGPKTDQCKLASSVHHEMVSHRIPSSDLCAEAIRSKSRRGRQ